MRKQEQESRRRVLKSSGAVLAFFIGSGFASGQEVLQFFGAYGTGKGTMGVFLSLFLIFLSVRQALIDGRQEKYADASQIFSYYCGPYAGHFLEWLTPVFLFLSYCVMLSGSGALLAEYFKCSPWAGRLVMLGLSLGTVMLGLGRLTDIIGMLGPVIVAFVFCLGSFCVGKNPEGILRSAKEVQEAGILAASGNWWMSAVLYAGFSVMISLPFLSGMGKRFHWKRECSQCAVFGSLFFLLGALLLCWGMLAFLPEIAGKRVPTVFLADKIRDGLGNVFAVAMFLGIYTTAVPMLWSVCNKLAQNEKRWRFKITAILVSAAAYFWGGADFSFLVGTVYPYIGYFGSGVMVCMAVSTVKRAGKKRWSL